MNAILMSVAEPSFIPWIEESEEEAQDLVRSLLAVLRRTVDAAPSGSSMSLVSERRTSSSETALLRGRI